MNISKYFRTQKFNLATFLYVNDQPIVGMNQVGPGVKEFVFPLSAELEELVETYKFSTQEDVGLLVSVKKYEQARNELLDKLKD